MIVDFSNFAEILKVRVGSHCHGTNLPESDQDIRSVFIPLKDYWIGLKTCEMIEEKEDGKDIEYWNIQKLIKLCLKGNPSALNVLYVHKKDQFYVNEWGQELIDIRHKFLSNRTLTSIIGYCTSQLHKLTIGRGTKKGKRIQMIEKYGFDVKFCYHSVMLTNMAIELLKDNRYEPLRKDSEQQFLKGIRTGKVALEEVRHVIRENLETIKVLEPLSKLPKKPDEEKINKWMVDYIWRFLNKFE